MHNTQNAMCHGGHNTEVPVCVVGQLMRALGAAFTITIQVLLHPIKDLGTATPSGTDSQALIMQIVVTFSMMFIASAISTDMAAKGNLGGIVVGSAVCITSILAGFADQYQEDQ